ncbi:MAG: hypothetical protein BBJ57_08510 [Desulfobacterales bacterium PC51MH44]|nr:MAG: hypothetical protein BBJ57_08510 [Desulfobacterales bacterium PC51MH44]
MLKKDIKIEKDSKIGKDKRIDLKDLGKAEKGIGFKSKDQIFKALSPQIGDMKVMVKPTLKLSKKALETPLPPGWLNDIREFLTRTGKWKGHPTRSIEHFIITPAPGVIAEPRVVGDIKEPVFASLGFGDMIFKGDQLIFTSNICPVQKIIDSITIGGHCYAFICLELDDCHTYDDSDCDFDCSKYTSCGTKTKEEVVPDIQAHWNHPFVQELRDYFGVSSVETLTSSVENYIGRNMYDASAL